MKKINILMIGPLPPNVGGIASYIRDLADALEAKYSIQITHVEPYILSSIGIKEVILKSHSIIKNIILIVKYCFKQKQIVAHIHTSSNFSFLENTIYILFIKLFSSEVILHLHAPDLKDFLRKKQIIKFLIAEVFNLSNIVIVLSNYWRTILSNELDISPSKIVIIHNAASPKFRFRDMTYCREKLGLPQNRKIIFSLGNLIERKGFKYLINAIHILNRNDMNLLCYVGGSGESMDELKDIVNKLNLNQHIKFLGFVPEEEISLWINSSDLVVLPSLSEGVPIVMLEALNCGKPFIGTDVGGIPDIIISDDYGLLAKPADAEDLAQKIQLAMNKKWDKEKIISYSRKFSFDNISENLMSIYKKHIGNRIDQF